MTAPCLEAEIQGLSFAARAVLATVTALTYEHQESEIAVHILKRMLALSDDAWEEIYVELYASGALYRVADRYGDLDLVEAREGPVALRWAIGASGRPSPQEWQKLRDWALEEHGSRCFYCETESGPFAVDHVQPIARGGSNHRLNLVPACKSCNSAKGAKTWEEWYPAWAQGRA